MVCEKGKKEGEKGEKFTHCKFLREKGKKLKELIWPFISQ